MIGKSDLADHTDAFRLGLHALELDAVVGLVDFDPVEHPEKIEVPPGTAEFAVGGKFEPDLLLLLDDVFDRAILDRLELGGADRIGFALGARLFQCGGTQKAADMIGAKRRLGSFHRSGSSGVSFTTSKGMPADPPSTRKSAALPRGGHLNKPLARRSTLCPQAAT